jgi:hypothetical protein
MLKGDNYMLELCLAGIGGLIGYYKYINRDSIALKKSINQLKSQWKLCMSYANIKNHNDETYNILDIFPKQYGYNCIISIPFGLTAEKLYKELNMLENNFSCIISMNLSQKKNTLYIRFIFYPEKLSELDNIRIKWNKLILEEKNITKIIALGFEKDYCHQLSLDTEIYSHYGICNIFEFQSKLWEESKDSIINSLSKYTIEGDFLEFINNVREREIIADFKTPYSYIIRDQTQYEISQVKFLIQYKYTLFPV